MQILNSNNLGLHHRLTIIVMCHNQSAFLTDCVLSILRQSYRDFFVLIHDDASTDGSPELIKSITDKNEKISGILRFENRFSVQNDILQTILDLVDSQYILRIDADDFLFNRDQLSQQIAVLDQQPNTSFVYSDYLVQNEIRNSIERVQIMGKRSKDKLVPFVNFAGIGVMYRKPPSNLFPTNFSSTRAQDWYLLNLLVCTGDSHYLPNLTPVYRVHSNNRYFGIKDNNFSDDSRIIREFNLNRAGVRNRFLFFITLKFVSVLQMTDRSLFKNRMIFTGIFNRVISKIAFIRKSRFAFKNRKKLLAAILSDFNKEISLEGGDTRVRFMSIRDFLQLRKLKNRNRSRFFYSQRVGYLQHIIWFTRCRLSLSDSMLIICDGSTKVACLGFRLRNSSFDLYNVMRLTRQTNSDKSPMIGVILQSLCMHINKKYSISIKAEVLLNNPALTWYYKNGFEDFSRGTSSAVLEYRGLEKG